MPPCRPGFRLCPGRVSTLPRRYWRKAQPGGWGPLPLHHQHRTHFAHKPGGEEGGAARREGSGSGLKSPDRQVVPHPAPPFLGPGGHYWGSSRPAGARTHRPFFPPWGRSTTSLTRARRSQQLDNGDIGEDDVAFRHGLLRFLGPASRPGTRRDVTA